MLRELRKTNVDIEKSIFRAIHKCSVDTMVGVKHLGVDHSFLEYYDTLGATDDDGAEQAPFQATNEVPEL